MAQKIALIFLLICSLHAAPLMVQKNSGNKQGQGQQQNTTDTIATQSDTDKKNSTNQTKPNGVVAGNSQTNRNNKLQDTIRYLKTIIEEKDSLIKSLEAQIEGRDKRIQMLTTDSIQSKQVIAQKQKALEDKVIEQFGNHLPKDDQWFCRAVMESPLFRRYNKANVQFSLETAKAFGCYFPQRDYYA